MISLQLYSCQFPDTHTNHVQLGDAVLLHGEWKGNSILFDQHFVLFPIF